MANTVIQLKFSTLTATPTTLNVAEPAYSYASNTLFIGSPDGTGSIAIGGKFYIDKFEGSYNHANAAYDLANTVANAGSDNYARNHANAAFIQANTALVYATSAGIYANGAFISANSAGVYANGAFAAANNEAGVNATQNNSITSAFTAANSAGVYANGAFAAANTADNKATSAGVYANGAFVRANNSIDANTGGTITGDLSITGNLSVLGNTFTISSTTIVANDTVIILGANNYTSDLLDIGFGAHYNDGANAHTGLIRDHGTKEWQLFEGYIPEIGANNDININDPSFKIATLNANVHSTKILIKGIDLLPYVNTAFNTANAAFASANNTDGVNATQNNSITSAFIAANSAGVYANGAFAAANTADNKATSAGVYANGAFVVANSAQVHANYAFNHANAAFSLANGTAGIANTDVTNISISAANYGSASAVAAFRVEANGRISSANSTAIAIDTSAITSGILGVVRGGTGAGSFTTNGVLLGQGASALTTASSSTEGHLLTINQSGVPTFSHLQGGTF